MIQQSDTSCDDIPRRRNIFSQCRIWVRLISVPECIDGSAYHFAQCVFELDEDLLDGIEVRAVGCKETHCCTRGFDGFPKAGAFMGTEIVPW